MNNDKDRNEVIDKLIYQVKEKNFKVEEYEDLIFILNDIYQYFGNTQYIKELKKDLNIYYENIVKDIVNDVFENNLSKFELGKLIANLIWTDENEIEIFNSVYYRCKIFRKYIKYKLC